MDHECTPAERYRADPNVDAAYLDVMPCNDAAAVRTVAAGDINIDIRTDTGEITGIELLTLESPLARWIAQAAEALYRLEGLDK